MFLLVLPDREVGRYHNRDTVADQSVELRKVPASSRAGTFCLVWSSHRNLCSFLILGKVRARTTTFIWLNEGLVPYPKVISLPLCPPFEAHPVTALRWIPCRVSGQPVHAPETGTPESTLSQMTSPWQLH